MMHNFTVWKLHSLNPAPLIVPWNLMTIETNNKGVKLSVWGSHGLLEQTSWGSAENHGRSQTTQITIEKICQELPVILNLRETQEWIALSYWQGRNTNAQTQHAYKHVRVAESQDRRADPWDVAAFHVASKPEETGNAEEQLTLLETSVLFNSFWFF